MFLPKEQIQNYPRLKFDDLFLFLNFEIDQNTPRDFQKYPSKHFRNFKIIPSDGACLQVSNLPRIYIFMSAIIFLESKTKESFSINNKMIMT